MKEPAPLPFRAEAGYRRRRLIEAMRLLPVVGLLLFILPVLWATGGPDSTGTTSGGGIYIFVICALLIIVAAIFSRVAGKIDQRDGASDDAAAPDDAA